MFGPGKLGRRSAAPLHEVAGGAIERAAGSRDHFVDVGITGRISAEG